MSDTRDETARTLGAASRFLASAPPVQVGFWFLVVLVVKRASLFEPPVWDSVMGVFPPAVFLYETGFDIVGLLQQPNWWEGGPNVHSLSLLTWVIAAVMKLTGSPVATFAILHLLTFLAIAWSLQLFTRVLSSYGLAAGTVLAAASFLLFMPVVFVQVGYIYTESLVMAASVAAWAYWREERFGLAVAACVIAIFLKLTAIAIAASVFAVALLSARRLGVRRTATFALIPLALFVYRALPGWLGASQRTAANWGAPEALLQQFVLRMHAVPDLQWLLVAGLICPLIYVALCIWRDRGFDFLTRADTESRSKLICLAMPGIFVAGVVAMAYDHRIPLTRYLLPAIPFAIGSILLLAASIRAERVAQALLIGATVFSMFNHDGRFYSPNYNSFSVVERSSAYRDFLAVQMQAIRALESKPDAIPAFVGKEVDYMTSDRMMGYVDEPIANTYPIYIPPYQQRSLEQFPDEFLLLRTNVGHGGMEIGRLVEAAKQSPDYTVKAQMFKQSGFRAVLYGVRRVRGQQPADN